MRKIYWYGVAILLFTPTLVQAQSATKDYTVISTAVPFLAITPDSRAAGTGDAGAASTFDANAIYWNPGKMAFSDSKYGASVSYTPWLRQIVNDMGLINAAGYYKISDKQTIGASINVFNQGEIQFMSEAGDPRGTFKSNEFAITAGIAQKLSSDYSLGLNIKYINSNLVGNLAIAGATAKPGRTAAMDLGFYYNKTRPTDDDPETFKKLDIDYGVVLQNIGGKMNYGFGEYFIPANLKLGTKLSYRTDPLNTFTFLLDFNKLLVPTPNDSTDHSDVSSLGGIFKSFGDAPGGFSEELSEIMTSIGFEYSYQNLIALRTGYFHESKKKAGRQYITLGAGVTLKEKLKVDLAYLVPTKSGSPLANSWRITLRFQMPYKSSADAIEEEIVEE